MLIIKPKKFQNLKTMLLFLLDICNKLITNSYKLTYKITKARIIFYDLLDKFIYKKPIIDVTIDIKIIITAIAGN